jgi:rhodanese-related sulfurtransferase
MTTRSIPAPEFAELLRREAAVEVIDVRTPAEFQEFHLECARNVPLDQLDPAGLGRDSDRPLYVVCRSGSRGHQASEKLRAAGCQSVVNVEGGTLACIEAGLPVVRGRKVMSLERQVRICLGIFVLASALLTWLYHPAFLGVVAFLGGGLIFSGVTDTCGMAMILARMPWNQRPRGSSATCAVR